MCDFFNFFKILILWVVKGLKGQKSIQNNKNALCHALYFRKHIFIYDTQCEWKDNISRHFFHFFKILIFEIIRGFLRAKKMAQNDKIFCLSHSISQERYIVLLWFLVHIGKIMIPPAIFPFFQNVDLFGF